MDVISTLVLPIVFCVVGIGLVWLIIELVLTLRKTRTTLQNIDNQIKPTLANVQTITNQVQPILAKVDPIVDRVSLTIDAANLEIMRVDQILEDVGQITDSVAKAVDAVDTITNAPIDLVNTITDKVRAKLHPPAASEQSMKLGEGHTKELEQKAESDDNKADTSS